MTEENRTASELRDVAVRGLLGKLPGNWPIIADIGMHIMGPSTDAALAKGKKYLGDVVGGYWKRMGEEPARATYGNLTEKGESTTQKPSRPADPFFNPDNDVIRKSTNFLQNDAGWRKPFYEHPEMTASAVGATTAAAPLIAGGLFLDAFSKGQKPRSDYAYPVEPTRGSYDETGGVSASSNAYNPSVESARASAQFKHQLEEQKFAHKMALMNAREQSRTPGVQNTSMGSYGGGGPMDNSAIIGLLQNQFGNTRTYF